MSRQLSLEDYFSKSKASTSKSSQSSGGSDVKMNDAEKKRKKRNLSLKKVNTPTKSPKVSQNDRNVVNLCSDDEDDARTPCNLSQRSNVSGESVSAASDDTITYSLTPESTKNTSSTFATPQKSSQVAVGATLSQNYRSPRSKEKYFSPAKNRSVVKRAPLMKVKRSLSMEMANPAPNYVEDALFTAACEDMDDKTIFLLTIINKFNKDASLRQLLDSDAQALLNKCLEVVKPGMRLVCRLYWRKVGWYKREQVSQISCEGKESLDDPSLELMMNSLVESGLITKGDAATMAFDELKEILNKDELVQACKELNLKVSSKQDAIKALTKFSRRASNITDFLTGSKSSNSGRVLKIMSSKAGCCYKLSDFARATLYKLHILMYLGMDYSIIREKKLELVLLYDKVQRETYPVDKQMALDNASIVFQSREQFERYLTAHKIYEDFLIKTDCTDKCNSVKQVYILYKEIGQDEMLRYTSLPTWLRRYTPAHIYVKILEAGVQDLKKDKDGGHYLLALDVLTALIAQNAFRQHKKAEWYAEKALILHSLLYRCDEAAEVLLQGFKSDMSDEAKDSMRPRARKIANQKNAALSEHLKRELLEHATKENILEKNLFGKHVYKQPMDRTSNRGKVKFETRTTDGRMVLDAEEYCIAHYLSDGFTGEHWESRIVTTIFFLLFWDIIYTNPPGVRGVFLSHYQQFPLDLFTACFYANRKAAIDNWLKVIERAAEDKLLKIMHDTWISRPEVELSGIHRKLGWDNVRGVASCLGAAGLAAVCCRLATNYSYAHSGFPDLTLWNTHTKQIKFVEVKTDSDKPSMKQIQWMHYLKEHGIDTEFCYLGVNTTRQRCRTGATPHTNVKKEPRRRIKREKKVSKTMEVITTSRDTDPPKMEDQEPRDAEEMEFTSSQPRRKNTNDVAIIDDNYPQVKVKSEPSDVEIEVTSSLEIQWNDSESKTSSQVLLEEPALKIVVFSPVTVKEELIGAVKMTSTEGASKKEPNVAVKYEVSPSQDRVKKELLDDAVSPCVSQCY